MKIGKCPTNGLITAGPSILNRPSSESVVHEASGIEEIGAEAMGGEFELEGVDLEEMEEDVAEDELEVIFL